MGLFSNKYNTPFDNEDMRRVRHVGKPRATHIKAAGYMTTRSALFLGYTLISLCLIYSVGKVAFWWPIACSAVVLLLWSVTLRFFMRPKLSALAFILVALLFAAASEASYMMGWCNAASGALFIPMSIGIMSLSRFKADDEDEFSAAFFTDEVFKPYVLAVAASAFGFFASGLFEKRYIFTTFLAATAFLILFSWGLSRVSGTPRLFTSRSLTEFWDIPVADFQEIRRFVFARSAFAILMIVIAALLFALWVLVGGSYARMISVPAAALVQTVISVSVLSFSRGGIRRSIFGLRYFVSETAIGAQFLAVFFLSRQEQIPSFFSIAVAVILAILADTMLTALLSVIRRRQIFVTKSRYIDGLPFYLILTSLICMIVETCLYSLTGL
ncbi:MAG: hypothetical protein E7386_05570 [Ruminococcaceae bacterium]|nr:hypothetical protein [Oscillospiraceae bacterium]